MRMRYLFVVVSVLCSMVAVAQPQHHEKEVHWMPNLEKIRIISYNTLAAIGGDSQEALTEWLIEQDPEIIAFQELCGINEEKLLAAAKEWGHNYAVIVKEDGYPVGLTSKMPIDLITKRVDGYGHGMIHARIYGLNCIVTHLNPGKWKKRLVEANNIVEYIEENELDRVVLMGDMNAHSPMDADYLENNAFLLPMMRGGTESENCPYGNFDYHTISRLLSTPLYDAIYPYVKVENRMSFPTKILMNVPKSDYMKSKREERLDYILISGSLIETIVDGFVFNGEETEYISDHYPVAIDLLLDKGSF